MKFLSCHIENFGRLSNFDYNFSDGLNEILQDNGWGKTTFAVFMKAMLYGMSKKGNNKAYSAERSKYSPWYGGVYGGTLTFEQGGHKYKMYRTFGSTPERDMFSLIDLETNTKTNAFSENIGYEIYGVGRDTFEITTYFAQMSTSEKLNDEMRANLSGVNNLQNDLASYGNAIEDIDDRLKQYKREFLSLSKNNDNLFAITKLEKKIEEEEENILKLQDEIEVLEDKRDELKEDYDKAQRQIELRDLSKTQITDIKEALVAKKSDLLAFQIKLQELEKENLRRGMRNKFTISNRRARNILFYSTIAILVVLATLFVFEFIFNIILAFKYVTIGAMIIDTLLMVYCIRANSKDHDKFNQKIDLETYQKQIEGLKEDVQKLQNILDSKVAEVPTQNFEEPDTKGIIREYTSCERQITEKNAQIQLLQRNIENFEVEKENVSNEQLDMENKKAVLTEKIKLITYVKKFMQEAKTNVSKRYIAPMQERFTKLIEKIVSEDAKKYTLDVDMNVSVDDATGNKEVEYLSQGYQDLINICRRFSLIESIFLKEKPIIILDDPFVNLDDRIVENAMKLLNSLAKDYQIVHLCCHSSRKVLKNA